MISCIYIIIICLLISCSDHQTEDRQQPVRQRFPGLVAAHRHGEVPGILGPALFTARVRFPAARRPSPSLRSFICVLPSSHFVFPCFLSSFTSFILLFPPSLAVLLLSCPSLLSFLVYFLVFLCFLSLFYFFVFILLSLLAVFCFSFLLFFIIFLSSLSFLPLLVSCVFSFNSFVNFFFFSFF